MKVPPLSLVGMERLPLPLPFSPELLWRYNTLGPPPHHHSAGPPPGSPASNAVVSAAAAAISRATAAAAAAASIPSPLAHQLPFAYDIKHTIPLNLGEHRQPIFIISILREKVERERYLLPLHPNERPNTNSNNNNNNESPSFPFQQTTPVYGTEKM
jgi:hypothetical protein